jgi:SnoaL-like polyketide cyclase
LSGACCYAAFGNNQTGDGAMALEEKALKFRTFVEAWTKRRLDAVDEMLGSNVVYHMPPFPDFQGTEPLKQFIANFHAAFPNDFQVFVDEDLAVGNATVHRWHVSGTYSGQSPLLPVAPTGKHTSAAGCHICHWAEDKCTEIWHFGDWLGWLQKAGVMPELDKLA